MFVSNLFCFFNHVFIILKNYIYVCVKYNVLQYCFLLY